MCQTLIGPRTCLWCSIFSLKWLYSPSLKSSPWGKRRVKTSGKNNGKANRWIEKWEQAMAREGICRLDREKTKWNWRGRGSERMVRWLKQLNAAFGISFLWLICLIYFTQVWPLCTLRSSLISCYMNSINSSSVCIFPPISSFYCFKFHKYQSGK